MSSNTNSIYHERQSMELCALHALNNLFQGKEFTRERLEEICKSLAPNSFRFWNPHKSVLGLGNYDINVIMTALADKNCSAIWFDRRKSTADIAFDNIVGLVINTPSQTHVGPVPVPFVSRRHWIALRKIAGAWFNLDSKLPEPALVEPDIATYLAAQFAADEHEKTQLFIVVSKDVEENMTWRKSEAVQQNGN